MLYSLMTTHRWYGRMYRDHCFKSLLNSRHSHFNSVFSIHRLPYIVCPLFTIYSFAMMHYLLEVMLLLPAMEFQLASAHQWCTWWDYLIVSWEIIPPTHSFFLTMLSRLQSIWLPDLLILPFWPLDTSLVERIQGLDISLTFLLFVVILLRVLLILH